LRSTSAVTCGTFPFFYRYPWGSEAFEKARELNRPIFLSVGYSTCHWCHVMEKESFESVEIARLMNKDFVCIKVDREERPDVDKLYMAFIQATTGSGGWPMTVFLTPDLDPITGGTYFPPRDSAGSLGLPSVLRIVSENVAIGGQGQMITNAGAFKYKQTSFDEVYGGFGNAPKFPKACDLEFLINHYCWTKQDAERNVCSHMLEATLDGMARGGIHDHVGKGFHRYSVDEEWHVPHFEKMLYDQTQLLGIYADHCRVFGKKFCHVVEDIAEYMEQCLSHKEGGFYAAEDADSLPTLESREKREGAFCVWEMNEIKELLKDVKVDGKDGVDVFCQYFDVKEEGNVESFRDPHGELRGRNVLRMKQSHEEFAEELGVSSDELSTFISKAKSLLADVRSKRPPPHLDSKMVCAWQGLAITGLVKASLALSRPQYTERAVKTVEFVKKYLMDEHGQLLRSAYRGEDGSVENTGHPIHAFSDDYAMLIQGLLDLYQVTADLEYLKLAERLQNDMVSKESGYFIANEHGDVKVRVMEDQDGAEPCANSIAVGNLIRLYDYLETSEFKRKAEKILQAYRTLAQHFIQIVVVGPSDNESVKAFKEEINSHFIWNRLVLFLDPSTGELVVSLQGRTTRRCDSLRRFSEVGSHHAGAL
uniref:Thioredox_DsbH domain-containing protein n=1 Tax=Heligmosomoides polygyrus TaxID=6339 RepID=A0A8L8Q486_HELPZ